MNVIENTIEYDKNTCFFSFSDNLEGGFFVDILLLFLTVTLHESGTSKAIFWSKTIYNKNLSSQCNLTAQIEQVQDKDTLYLSSLSFNRLSFEG
jgi:hypothetical protein